MENKKHFNPERTFNIIVQESDEFIYSFALEEKAKFSSLSAVLFAWYNCIYFYLIEESETLYSSLYSALEKYGIKKFTPKFINDYNEFCQKFCQTIDMDEIINDKIIKLCMAIYISLIFEFDYEADMWRILHHLRNFLNNFAPNSGSNCLNNYSNLDDIVPILYVNAKEIKVQLPRYIHNRKNREEPKSNTNENFPWGCLLFGIIGAALLVIIVGIIASGY